MKKIFILFFTLLSVITSAQIFTPVEWEFSQKQLSDTEIELQFKATIDSPWHMYSQFVDDEILASKFTFIYDGDTIISKLNEPKPSEEYDETSDIMLLYFFLLRQRRLLPTLLHHPCKALLLLQKGLEKTPMPRGTGDVPQKATGAIPSSCNHQLW